MPEAHPDRSDGPTTPLAVTAIALMATMAAFIALIVAGLAAADLFPAVGDAADAAANQGVWMSTQAWANPLGILGLGVIFGVAIPLALRNVRSAIDYRRTAMVASLPILIKGANQ